jgi:ABC-type sugar transport system substrate-binding protein
VDRQGSKETSPYYDVKATGYIIIVFLLVAAGAKAKEISIGIVARGTNTEEKLTQSGALAAAKEQNSRGDNHVAIDWHVALSTPEAVLAIRDMARRKVDGIALAGYDEETLQTAIEVQRVNGIPVVACGGAGPLPGATAVLGTNNYACGQQLMEALAKEISNHGLIAIFGGDYPGNPYFGPRVHGAQDKAKDYPDIQIAAVTYAGPDPRDVAARMLNVSTAREGLGGWVMVVNWGLPSTTSYQSQPGPRVVTVDPGIEMGIRQLESRQLQALLVQDFYGWGRQSVLLLADKTLRPKEPENNFIPFGTTVVTHENVERFLETLREQLANE